MTRAWLLALAACGSAADEVVAQPPATVVEPNDVAILYPLAARLDEYLTPAAQGRGGALVPRDLYERAFGTALQLGGTPAAPSLDGLRLVAIRFDPCFGARCTSQIRLVFQTLELVGDRAIARDDAVHAFYEVERAELVAAVAAVAALRGAAPLGELAPHPLLVAQGLGGPAAQAIARTVLRYAGAANLVKITAFTSSGLGTAWNFFGADIASGAASPVAIPTLPGVRLEAFFAGFVDGELTGDPAFTPANTALAPRDDVRLLANRERAARAAPAERERALEATRRIEDPAIHTPDTIDCVSCHVADTVRRTTHREINLHMLGYKGSTASIQTRTVREVTATIASLQNRSINQ